MSRLLAATTTALIALAVGAPSALADLSGEGLYGEITDAIVTKFFFYVIFLLPVFLAVMSILQASLEKRKEARKSAAKGADERFADNW